MKIVVPAVLKSVSREHDDFTGAYVLSATLRTISGQEWRVAIMDSEYEKLVKSERLDYLVTITVEAAP